MATRLEREAIRARRGKKSPWKMAPKSVKNSFTSPRRIATEKDKARALELRAQGLPYDEIGEILGRAHSTVSDWVSECLERMIVEPTLQLAKLELTRLDSIIAKIYPRALAGDDNAQRRLLDYLKHRCILLGLYPRDGRSPVNIALIQNAGTSNNALDISFVMPDGRRLALLDAEEITPGQFDARPQQTRPLPVQQIEHQHPFEADTVRPREPRHVREYKGPPEMTGTELDAEAQPRGTGQGRVLDHGPSNGGRGWLK